LVRSVLCLVVTLQTFIVADAAPAPANADRGRLLAQKYCASCHLFPEPELLTKSAWVHHIQPEMAKWLGMERVDFEGMPDGKLLQEAALYPSSPLLSEEDWFAIWDYYRAAAPSRPRPPVPWPEAAGVLTQFRARKISPGAGAPMTTMVKIDSVNQRIFLGDAFAGALFTLKASGELLARQRLPSAPVGMERDLGGRMFVTCIGRTFPSDALEGGVFLLPGEPGQSPAPVLNSLRRPTQALVADLNGDGREDLVVCAFGNRLGTFSWFENQGEGRYEEHVLLDRPGALRAEARDFNGDGRLDLLVQMGQAREAFHLFLNQGGGRFQMETLLEQPPTWGYVDFELADFNKDGHPDLVVANGDNGDFSLPLKPYHGIRIYLNDGKNHFQETQFYPMHGAYKAIARDFDGDGDLDIAAIAFFPDFAQAVPENFVYLEHRGGLKFKPFHSPETQAGRWIVMDAGDVDGDGDEDLVLGSFVRGPTTIPVPMTTRERWRTEGAALLLLENLRR